MNILLRAAFVGFLTSTLLLINPVIVMALNLTVSNFPSSLDDTTEAEVDLFLECDGCGDSYIRGVFFPGGTNYFGLTQNNFGEWIGTESDRSKYFHIAKTDLIESSWSGKIKVKIDKSASAYGGPGEYIFKAGRYTSSTGSSASWSNEIAVNITGITPSPSPSPTAPPTSTPVLTPNSTPTKTPTKTPTSTPLRSLVPQNPTASPSPTPTTDTDELVLGVKDTPTPDTSVSDTAEPEPKRSILGFVVIGIGIVLIGASVLLAIKPSIFGHPK